MGKDPRTNDTTASLGRSKPASTLRIRAVTEIVNESVASEISSVKADNKTRVRRCERLGTAMLAKLIGRAVSVARTSDANLTRPHHDSWYSRPSGALVKTTGLLHGSEMGSALGRGLLAAGHRVVTCVTERGSRTRSRAYLFDNLASIAAVVANADVMICVVDPLGALALAEDVARMAAGRWNGSCTWMPTRSRTARC